MMYLDQLRLINRYNISGKLQLVSPLKIGYSTEGLPRTPDGAPIIPGSTMRGAFRRHIERVLASLGRTDLESCSMRGGRSASCIGANQTDLAELKKLLMDDSKVNELDGFLRKKLCAVCKLFGAQFIPSKLSFPDLLPFQKDSYSIGERRGMAIDRTTEVGKIDTRYRYEVVERGSAFQFVLFAENLDADNLAILALGLLEAQRGGLRLGGGRSHGAGSCSLDDLEIRYFEGVGKTADEKGKLLAYLDQGEEGMAAIDAKSSSRQLRNWQRRLL